MAIGKRLRWQVLRRDNFACRYCGATATGGAVLEVDHMHPSARGGSDDPSNLITACEPCNAGKSDIPLDAPTVDDVPQDALRDEVAARKWAALKACVPVDSDDFDITCAVAYSHAFGELLGIRSWGAWHVSRHLALAVGRTPHEILRACEAAGAARDVDLFRHMPYVPDPVESSEEQATYEYALDVLGDLIPAEQIAFIWAARRRRPTPQPGRRRLVRLAGALAVLTISDVGRDADELRRWLSSLPDCEGSAALAMATAEWDQAHQGERGGSAWEHPEEVLELAVSIAIRAGVSAL